MGDFLRLWSLIDLCHASDKLPVFIRTAWLDVNIRSAAPLEETLLVVVELTEIDDSSSSGRRDFVL